MYNQIIKKVVTFTKELDEKSYFYDACLNYFFEYYSGDYGSDFDREVYVDVIKSYTNIKDITGVKYFLKFISNNKVDYLVVKSLSCLSDNEYKKIKKVLDYNGVEIIGIEDRFDNNRKEYVNDSSFLV